MIHSTPSPQVRPDARVRRAGPIPGLPGHRAARALLATGLALALTWPWAGMTVRAAPSTGAADTASPSSAPGKNRKKSPRARQVQGSGESAAERDRRLLRECRGRPNAGACYGYAS